MGLRDIEKFFLNTILKICIGGVTIILVSNILLYPEDRLSINIASVVLCSCVIAFLIRRHYPNVSILLVTCITLTAMCYQRIISPTTTTALSVVLIVGFMFSVMLRGKLMWAMHVVAIIILNTIFVYNLPDAITAAITYTTLYVVLTFSAGKLKDSYDKIHQNLHDKNMELRQQADEIAAQNEELRQIQDNLNSLNNDLERVVLERTMKIQIQNDVLMKYSFTNAHYLRGPVARLLGLAAIYKIDPTMSPAFVIEKMADQAIEIDLVIKQINRDLEETAY